MGLIELGGWMMWPLLAVSVAALAIVVERALVFMGCPVSKMSCCMDMDSDQTAAAPPTISEISWVIAAWRALL